MAVTSKLPEETQQQVQQQAQATMLAYNEFRLPERRNTVDAANNLIRVNAKPEKVLSNLTMNGAEVPLIQRDSIAVLNVANRSTWGAIRRGEPIFVIGYEQTSKAGGKTFTSTNYVAVSSAEGLGNNTKGIEEKAGEVLKSNPAPGSQRIISIHLVNHVYDCTTFVNTTLKASKSQLVKPNVGITVNEAMERPGQAIIETYKVLRAKREDQNPTKEFFANAHAGDVLVFLEKTSPEEAKEFEEMTGDKPVWHDGVPYRVGHIALYMGESKDGEPVIAQAHIYAGTIVKESGTYYVKNYHHDAAVLISHDFFKQEPTTVATASPDSQKKKG